MLIALVLVGCTVETQEATTDTVHTFYIPVVFVGDSSNVGVMTESPMRSVARWHNPTTAIKIAVRGADVMASSTHYDWSKSDGILAGYHADWINITTSPPWMAEDRIICNLPKSWYWHRYAEFVQAVIDRYHPDAVEIWNEPDIAYGDMPPEHAYFYGCVGDGEKYAEFSDYISENTSGADVIIGALASPYTPFITDLTAHAEHYDGLSFHCYTRLYGSLFGDCRADYRQAALWTDRPVYLSETAVLYRSGLESQYEQAQLVHYEQLQDIPTVWFWYTLANNGWPVEMPTDMVSRSVPRPVWYEYIGQ